MPASTAKATRDEAVQLQDVATLEESIRRAVGTVRSLAPGTRPPMDRDPLEIAGRRALATIADRRVDRAIAEWRQSWERWWEAAQHLAELAADDALRGGRHQRVYDAGVRCRAQVLAQRRAAFMAASRTARRMLLAACDERP